MADKAGKAVTTQVERETIPTERFGQLDGARVIELGSGPRRMTPDATTLDSDPSSGADLIMDARAFLQHTAPASLGRIQSRHFLEHVDELEEFMELCASRLEVGGEFHAIVPHWSNPFFYSDPTHRTFFGLYTMSYFAKDPVHARRVPQYSAVSGLVLDSVRLGFGRELTGLKRWAMELLEAWVNKGGNSEFYERWLSRLISCYEVEYRLRRIEVDSR